ncbi:MAG: SAM-dependent methyltransferase [Bacteroidaceae bacterium]|nr:SAM-dependent methyltransferase [Bacteroidaceae bacterium]
MENNKTEHFIREHRTDDVRKLALASHPKEIDLQYALTQISGWQAAKSKLPLWADTDGVIYPRHLSMEQCTSQYIAQYKASVVEQFIGKDFKMADLTGGFGVDCFFISRSASSTCYNEMSSELCDIALNNYKVLQRSDIAVTCGSAEDFIAQQGTFDLLYLDPARRDGAGRKVVSISDCQPDIKALQDNLLKAAKYVMVKLSPMLDISRALTELRNVSRILIIGLEGECKELVFILERGYSQEPVIKAVDINADGTPEMAVSSAKSADNALPLPIAAPEQLLPGTYISEPSAPYMKSALFRTIAAQTGTALLHLDTHLFWSKEKPESFPGRIFKIEGIIPFDKRSLSALTKTQANLSVRNFPETAPALQQKLKLRDGGPRYLIATTLKDGKRVLLNLQKEK